MTCHPGLEQVVAQELKDLGIEFVRAGKAGVSFWSDEQVVYGTKDEGGGV